MREADRGGNWVLFWWALLSKSLIQYSVDGWGCVPSLLFDLRPNYGGGNEDNGNLLQKAPCMHCCMQCPQPCSRPPPTHASARDSWTLAGKSGSVSCWGHCSFLLGLGAHKVLFVPSKSLFPSPVLVLAALWWVNGDLLQEDLCHNQVYCTQSLGPCSSPLLTCTSSVQFSHSVVSNSLQPHGPQHAGPPCPSPSPGVYSNSCPLSRWCHPTISSSVVSFSSCPQSFPASGSFQMSQFFASGGQSIGVSASTSVLPVNTQDWSPLRWLVGSLCSPRDSQESSPTPQFKSINSLALSLLYSPTLTSIHDHRKNHSLDNRPLL